MGICRDFYTLCNVGKPLTSVYHVYGNHGDGTNESHPFLWLVIYIRNSWSAVILVRDAQPPNIGRRSQSGPRSGAGRRFPAGEPQSGSVQGRYHVSRGGQVLGVEEGKRHTKVRALLNGRGFLIWNTIVDAV